MTATHKIRLGVFARPPHPGRVKTRLIPDIGAAAATEVYRHCLEYTLKIATESKLEFSLFLSEAGEDALFAGLPTRVQRGDDLGDRMQRALAELLAEGADGAMLIGSDCLDLRADSLQRAADLLRDNDLVLAPAHDGGYALIGCRQAHPDLFENIAWGSAAVLATTLERAARLGYRVGRLETVRDVDRLRDLEHYPELRRLLPSR